MTDSIDLFSNSDDLVTQNSDLYPISSIDLADLCASLISSILAPGVLPTAVEPIDFFANVVDLVSTTIVLKDFSNSLAKRAKKYVWQNKQYRSL